MSGIKRKPADWISLIEAGYNLDGTDRQWLDSAPGSDCAISSAIFPQMNFRPKLCLVHKGRCTTGQGQAVEKDSRENLREAVRCIEQARTQAGRSEPDDALDNWEALVDGRWSLVDRFDHDGKRYIIAVLNDPAHPDLRGLTAGERQVAEFVGLGRSTKQISYALGVSNSAVTNSTSRIQEKLGLSSHVELVSFFSQAGPRRKLAEVAVEGERLLVEAYPLIDERWIKDLTEAESQVTAQMIAGSTNADIAKRREVSEHTIANQVQAIFRKLLVRSRSELAARLQAKR